MPPLPKDPSQRRRRNKETRLPLADDGQVRGPDPDPSWSDATVGWWETWRRSLQAQVFEATDWQRLAMLARVVERFHTDPDLSPNAQQGLLAEIRQNESSLGATLADRIRLKIDVKPPDVAEPSDEVDAAEAEVIALVRGA